MPTALIKLAWRQTIDASSPTPFEQQVFHATYHEFRLQQQSFSKGLDLPTWSAIKERFPKSNPTLPFKVSFAIAGLLQTLDKKIPGLTDTLNLKPLPFVNHYFQLLESDIRDASAHKVSIIYLTDTLTFFGSFGDRLLLALGDARAHTQPAQTFMLRMEERLSIISYQELRRPAVESTFPPSCALPSQASLFP
jgi:hypothetical protein